MDSVSVTAKGDDSEHEICAAIDENDEQSRFLIADLTRDDAWLAMAAAEAPTLCTWR